MLREYNITNWIQWYHFEKVQLPGIEPGTYRVLGGRHNQLDHSCLNYMHYPGFEPGLSLPQSEVLTTILIVQVVTVPKDDRLEQINGLKFFWKTIFYNKCLSFIELS